MFAKERSTLVSRVVQIFDQAIFLRFATEIAPELSSFERCSYPAANILSLSESTR